MAPFAGLSGAHAVLLVVRFCASGNVTHVPQLQTHFPRHLTLARILRMILTFLPESVEPRLYTQTLQNLVDGISDVTDAEIDISSVKRLSEAAARKRVRKLHLLPLKHPNDNNDNATDLLSQFLVHRAHRIDTETSLQPLVLELLLPFYHRFSAVRTFLISSLLPLLRLNYEYYPNRDEALSLETLESMDSHTAINVLLSMVGPEDDPLDLSKNLRGLLGPWMYDNKRRKRHGQSDTYVDSDCLPEGDDLAQPADYANWQYVNEWLLSRSLVDRESVVGAFACWDGPADVDLGGYADGQDQMCDDEKTSLRTRYGQAGIAVVYASPGSSKPVISGSVQIVSRVARLLDLEDYSFITADDAALPSVVFDTKPISSTSRISLLQSSLLHPSNPLTCPSACSISFLTAILLSLQVLNELGHIIPCRTAANMCLYSNMDIQLQGLRHIVTTVAEHKKPVRDWAKARRKILWLRNWQGADPAGECRKYLGLFWRLPREIIETEILKALLESQDYQLAVDIYLLSRPAPLEPIQVERAVKEAIFTAYDGASNGNRTRGGMKRAYEILQTFQPCFPDINSFKQIHSLIQATHALSFYSLTLQHGVPLQPASIRIHPDPLSLLERVLDQNAKAYTKLDDLLSIGRSLVASGLLADVDADVLGPELSQSASESKLQIKTERRIMSLAISSALSSNDFDTAYSYILTRLAPLSPLTTSKLAEPETEDDTTWRAVYNAGRYRAASLTPPNIETQIVRLSQRMELLSLSLVLVPYPEPLPEILGAWRRCDEEMSVLCSRESEEEEAWDTRGDNTISDVPGSFGLSDAERDTFETKRQVAKRARALRTAPARANTDGAPMGLFDVARGAAAALQRNAFPLHAKSLTDSLSSITASGSSASLRSAGEAETEIHEGRTRKRDVVSNIVTGGLASGIGWVLGAQPANR